MKQFLEKASQYIRSEDPLVRDLIAFHLHDFPFAPSEIVNYQLKRAIEANFDEKRLIFTNINHQNVNENSLPLILELYEQTPKIKWHLLFKLVTNLPISLILQHENELNKFVPKDFFDFCRQFETDDQEELWHFYENLLNRLEEKYDDLLFTFAKKVQDMLIQKGEYNKQKIKSILDEELQGDWFTYNGILAVRAIGLLQLSEYIPMLASLLVRDEDILLEETTDTLIRFQSDEVVKEVTPYVKKFESYHFALSVLKHTKNPLAEQVLVECYNELPVDGKEIVIDGLTAHFSEHVFPLIEDFIANDYFGGVFNMEEIFYSFYKIMDKSHPLMEKWRQQIIKEKERMAKLNDTTSLIPKQKPVTSEKVGRNDPCPCGSGKKYKKCCGK